MLRYLDASVVIDTTEPFNPRREKTVAMLECFVRPTKANDATRLKQLGDFFASVPALDMPFQVYDRAIRLRAFQGLKTADALHLATALHHGCAEFWTNDLELAQKGVGLTFRAF